MLLRQSVRNVTVALVATIVLSACSGEDKVSVVITGEIGIADDVPSPESASARVSVFERPRQGEEEHIVAERTLHGITGKPIGFELEIARNLLTPDGRYGLRAELMGGDAQVLATSGKARLIEPLTQPDAGRIELKPVARDPSADFQKYRCEDEFQLSAAVDDQRAIVRLANRRLEMAIGEGGAIYTDAHDNRLARTESGIQVRIDDATHRQCALATDQAAASSPDQSKRNKQAARVRDPGDQSGTP